MKWYFALEESGSHHEPGVLALAAVRSCRRNTTLQPICLFDGINTKFIEDLRRLDVEVIQTQVPFADEIERHHQEMGYSRIARGAFLRATIPHIEKEDDLVLYTDVDVLFLKEPVLKMAGEHPFAAVQAEDLSDFSSFNSGVMLMNLPVMRQTIDEFLDFSASNLLSFVPGFDQRPLNKFYAGKNGWLDPILNWRPYWGLNDKAEILHFHGVKFRELASFFDFKLTDDIPYGPQLREFVFHSMKPMVHFASVFEEYCDDAVTLNRIARINRIAVEDRFQILPEVYRQGYGFVVGLDRTAQALQWSFDRIWGKAPVPSTREHAYSIEVPRGCGQIMLHPGWSRGPFLIDDLWLNHIELPMDPTCFLSTGSKLVSCNDRKAKFCFSGEEPQVVLPLPNSAGGQLDFNFMGLGLDPLTIYFGTPSFSETNKVVLPRNERRG